MYQALEWPTVAPNGLANLYQMLWNLTQTDLDIIYVRH